MANKSTSIYKIFLFISCCLWASHVAAAAAVDVLNQGDVLNSSASLVSRTGIFYLRFYNLSSKSNSMSSYLGIFYGNITNRENLIWIANRDRPITDKSGALVIDETGKLMITYKGGEAPLELYSGQSNNKVSAILQDDGNLVLKSGERILWQSFDVPTDCFLPGMKLGINHKTGQNWSLTSWLTSSIPAPGAFSLDWDPDEHQLILRRRGVTFWTSGVLLENSSKFENINLDGGLADYTHKFIEVSNEEGKYLTYEFVPNQYTPKNRIKVTWLWLEYDGNMGDQISSKGVLISDVCDGNSISSGCKRWEGPKCRSRGENLGTEWGYFSGSVDSLDYVNASVSLSDCKDICWKNCTCVGTANYILNSNGTGCTFWYGPLQESRNGMSASPYYIIHPGPPAKKTWVWILIAVAATLIVILLGILVLMRWRRLRLQEKFLLELMTLDNPSEAKELEIDDNKGHNLKVYSIASIMDATNCFSIENKLGEGGFGPVYKGLLFDGREIAIKRLSGRSRQGLIEFKNELILIAKLQHMNLVRLLGFCIHGEEKMLVYEYMPNKSLDSYIFDQSKTKLLDWNKCFNIIEGIAQGLLYLHKYSRLRIIHRDLKVMQLAKTIRQTKVWISWSGRIDSKTKGAERRKQRLGIIVVRIGKFRGPFERENELEIDIIICFRKAPDEPYKCYEDSIFYNGLQHIQFWLSILLRENLSWIRAGSHELDEMIRAELRGALQRAYEVGSSIIICFRKARGEPYKCYEDSVFYNRPHHIRIWPLSFRRAKTAVSSFMVFNYYDDSVRLFYFLLVYM